jgi:alcohol dehydrogenase (cytochrome c)
MAQQSPERGNVLTPLRDSSYDAAIAARRARLDAITPVTAEMLENPAVGDWLTYRRSYQSIGHSPLTQVNTKNVGQLREVWAMLLAPSGNEITPLVHDGVIFIESGSTIEALDGANGDELWQYVRNLPPALQNGRTQIVKNIAIYRDKVFAPTADGHMIALDVKTGHVVWDAPVLGANEVQHHLSLDGGPLVAANVVMMGASGCNTYQGGCFIFGLDADSGKELWRFHTIARPGEPGGDSWNGAPVEQRYGASAWTSGSYDSQSKLAYFGIAQTYDSATLLTPHATKGKSNDALYTDSTVALDPRTGRLAWYFQHMNRDVWDFDWVYEQSLITLPVHGRPTPLDVTGGKLGIFDAIDRRTGKYAFSIDLGFQTLVSSIDPKTGHKNINPNFEPAAGKMDFICPHPGGGRNWPATSYDPQRTMLFSESLESCENFAWNPRDPADVAAGGSDDLWIWQAPPHHDGKFGRLQAVNLSTHRIVWTYRQRSALASSILTTAGGLLFVGSRDRNFLAMDADNGKILWKARLDASPSSSPITYSAGGNQYVAVVTGNGGPQAWPFPTPEYANPRNGTTLWVFELPGRDAAATAGADSIAP